MPWGRMIASSMVESKNDYSAIMGSYPPMISHDTPIADGLARDCQEVGERIRRSVPGSDVQEKEKALDKFKQMFYTYV
jgi:hypothetical protein